MNPLFVGSLYGQIFSSATMVETADGGLLIHSAPGRSIMWIAVFLVVLPLFWWGWRRRIGGRYAPGIFFASFAIPLIVVPCIATEYVRVAPDALSIRTGFWFAPTDIRIPLTGLDTVIESDEAVDQRGVARHDTLWEFRYLATPPRKLALPDLLDANRAPVIEYLRQHGIQIHSA